MVQLVLPSRQSKPRLYSLCQSKRMLVVGNIMRAKTHSAGSFQSGGRGLSYGSQLGYCRKGRCAYSVHTMSATPIAGASSRRTRILFQYKGRPGHDCVFTIHLTNNKSHSIL